jgi:aspartate carbamoyltransferase catalytic subunit
MKNITVLTAAASALAAGIVGLAAPAAAAPTGGSAADTISQLEAQGNRVVVQRQGTAPLDEASVVSIRRGADVRQVLPNATSNGDNARSVSGQTVYVTVR